MRVSGYKKIEAVKADLAARGIPLKKSVPPVWRLLWRAGIAAPPPLFLGFRKCAALMGCMFGVLFGVMTWWEPFSARHSALWIALLGALMGAALMGPAMAARLTGDARKRRIPRWSTYEGRNS